MTDLEQLKTKALTMPEQARGLNVFNAETLTFGKEFIVDVKSMRKAIAESFDPIIRHAKAEKKKYDDPLKEADQRMRLNVGAYLELLAERQREAEEKARKKEEERQREEEWILAEAKILEDSGKEKEARSLEAEIPLPAYVEDKVTPQVEGLSLKQIVDTDKINRVVSQLKDKTQIPGIEVYPVYMWRIIDRKLIPKSYYRGSVASRPIGVKVETITQGKPEDA